MLQPFVQVLAQDPADGWIRTLFENENFTGKVTSFGGQASGHVIQDLNDQTSNWGTGSPSPEIGATDYSALFSKMYSIDQDGYYALTLQAGTGAQVFVDGSSNPLLDQWKDGSKVQHGFVYLTAGTHRVTLSYHHQTGAASLTFALTRAVTTYQATEPSVHANGGTGSPDWQVAPDHFTDQQWFTVRDGIIGGAQFVSQNWVNAGQDTLYKMRWNPEGAEAKGYATHE
jgi:hypothetical protein